MADDLRDLEETMVRMWDSYSIRPRWICLDGAWFEAVPRSRPFEGPKPLCCSELLVSLLRRL